MVLGGVSVKSKVISAWGKAVFSALWKTYLKNSSTAVMMLYRLMRSEWPWQTPLK
jgi:hypothetical protein